MEKHLINHILFLTIKVRRMWGAKTKNKAIDVWHTKAMLVDPKKTKITIIWNTASEICETENYSETQAINVESNGPEIITTSNEYHAKSLAALNQNFENAEQNFQAMESNMDETSDFETTENLGITKLNYETTEPEAIEVRNRMFSEGSVETGLENLGDMESFCEIAEFDDSEILRTEETLDDLKNVQPSLQSMASDVVEAKNPFQSEEDRRIMEQNLETVELKPSEALNAIASSENLTVEQPNEIEDGTACEAEDNNFELMPAEKVSENVMFLRVLEKTRSKWDNDKKFAKIVQKMEKGKKLRGKEFEQVYTYIRNYGQYN